MSDLFAGRRAALREQNGSRTGDSLVDAADGGEPPSINQWPIDVSLQGVIYFTVPLIHFTY